MHREKDLSKALKLLDEAAWRYQNFFAGMDLQAVYTGAGSRKTYLPAVEAGFMVLGESLGESFFYRLTPTGAIIVKMIIASNHMIWPSRFLK